jgi:hypothetical protein
MEEIFKSSCIFGFFPSKWGGSAGHLHLQMLYRLRIFSLLVLNQVVKHQFGWNDTMKVLIDHMVHYKPSKCQGQQM